VECHAAVYEERRAGALFASVGSFLNCDEYPGDLDLGRKSVLGLGPHSHQDGLDCVQEKLLKRISISRPHHKGDKWTGFLEVVAPSLNQISNSIIPRIPKPLSEQQSRQASLPILTDSLQVLRCQRDKLLAFLFLELTEIKRSRCI
jgi:hypothetical protein